MSELRSKRRVVLAAGLGAGVCVLAGVAIGQENKVPAAAPDSSILSRNPEVRVAKIDHERLAVRRLDLVDDQGRIRMTLAAPTPAPIVGGVQYRRAFPVSGLVIYDDKGNERGGLGIADIKGGAPVLAMDHDNMDAVGWRVMPDGSINFQMNQKPAGGAPTATPSRIRLTVAADGQPAIALADRQDRPRLRLTVTDQGYGALEFLDAQGRVVQTLAPETGRKAG